MAEQSSPKDKLAQKPSKWAQLKSVLKTRERSNTSPGSRISAPFMPKVDLVSAIQHIRLESAVDDWFLNVSLPTCKEDEDRKFFVGERLAAFSTSMYPVINGKRRGDPICDYTSLSCSPNRIVACIADGCNWGTKPRNAAHAVVRCFMENMRENSVMLDDTQEIALALLAAFDAAHSAIYEDPAAAESADAMDGDQAWWQFGTTTLLGACAAKVQAAGKLSNSFGKWIFVACAVGDCKAYRLTKEKATEVTLFNRIQARDATDPGGRLGPGLEGGAPDLRNLTFYSMLCDEGDLILLLSDGVHDNFDPHTLGKLPRDIGSPEWVDTWDALDQSTANKLKAAHVNRVLQSVHERARTPLELCDCLSDYCVGVTRPSREFMEANPGSKLPEDYTKFPGKLDHATCLCFKLETTCSLEDEPHLLPASATMRLGPCNTPTLSPVSQSLTPVYCSPSAQVLRRKGPTVVNSQLHVPPPPVSPPPTTLEEREKLFLDPSFGYGWRSPTTNPKPSHPASGSTPPLSQHRVPESGSGATSPDMVSLSLSMGMTMLDENDPLFVADPGEGCSSYHRQQHRHHKRRSHHGHFRETTSPAEFCLSPPSTSSSLTSPCILASESPVPTGDL